VDAETREVLGSAGAQGALWGARARDWAEVQEPVSRPLYEAVLRTVDIGAGAPVLDVGCGAGLFCTFVAERGARVSGVDAAAALLAIAKARVPHGDFREGEMEALPYPDRTFEVVTGFNAFQFAKRPEAALAEARRVARSGAPVVIATWGKPEDSEAAQYLAALRPLLPPAPPGAPGPFALSADGALAAFARRAGLTPQRVAEVECPLEYPDLDTALRGLLSAGPAVLAIQVSGEDRVREAIAETIAPYRLYSGGYRVEHSFLFAITTA
jgi:SAM-dependent methyltransferase